MVVDVTTEIDIGRPREKVAAFAADPNNALAWYKNIKAVEWETPPPVAVGSRLRFRARFLGRTLQYTYEVREIDPGRRFVMATAQGPFPMETIYSWEDAGPGTTRMALRNRGEQEPQRRRSRLWRWARQLRRCRGQRWRPPGPWRWWGASPPSCRSR